MSEDKMDKILKWTRIQGMESLKRIIQDFSAENLTIYDEADGETPTTEIANEVEVSQSTVSRRLKKWSKMEIVEKDGKYWEHLAPLESIGVEISEAGK